MNNVINAAKPKDYPSIEAFLSDHLPYVWGTIAMMTSDGYPQTINGVNAIMTMANTRGTSGKIRDFICGDRKDWKCYIAVHVESESTPTHASLTFLSMSVKRDTAGRVSMRYLPQRAFPTN